MDCLEYFTFMLRQRFEAGEMSLKDALEAIEELNIYARRANETAIEVDHVQEIAEREQAYLKREHELDKSKTCRALRRWEGRDRERRRRLREA
jgi:hypothetical protein